MSMDIRCGHCGRKTQVIDTRLSTPTHTIRRRRRCPFKCEPPFTTVEIQIPEGLPASVWEQHFAELLHATPH